MAFVHPGPVDARKSHFYSAGHDQHNVFNRTIIITNSAQEPTIRRVLSSLANSNGSPDISIKISSQKNVFDFARPSRTDVAPALIPEIVHLTVSAEPRDDYRCLKQELELLAKTVTLVGLAIEKFEYTPLCRNPANTLDPELERCCGVLRELFNGVNASHRALIPTSMRRLWSRVCSSGSEVVILRAKLSTCRDLLCLFVLAINS